MPGDEYAIDRYGSLPYWAVTTILALVMAGVFAAGSGANEMTPLEGNWKETEHGTL